MPQTMDMIRAESQRELYNLLADIWQRRDPYCKPVGVYTVFLDKGLVERITAVLGDMHPVTDLEAQ